jgi:hypothetical protein
MLFALTRSGIEFHWLTLVGAMVIAVKAPMLGWFFDRRAQAGNPLPASEG